MYTLLSQPTSTKVSFPFGQNGGGSTKNGSKLFLEMLTSIYTIALVIKTIKRYVVKIEAVLLEYRFFYEIKYLRFVQK
jgi:hypothetical protein